ncbi:MAG: hypothetical protein GY697_05540, partial [Desulfobacterales bacterium]|nr:hypothetical protein [Desulfobacterales bacterium]
GRRPGAEGTPEESETRFEKVIRKVSQFNIFVIGTLTFLTAVTVWMLPNMLQRIGTVGIEAIIRYKWVVLGMAAVLLGMVIWIIYLRYLLAQKSIESQVEVDKFRLQLEMAPENQRTILLPPGESLAGSSQPLVDFNKDAADKTGTDGKQT